MPDAKPMHALHIFGAVLAHSNLSLLDCAILSEVINLHGVQGHVFASDEHFAKRCHAKPRPVRGAIAGLVERGFLTREVDYTARHKRRLTPTDLWRNIPGVVADCAIIPEEETAPTKGVIPAEVVADSATTSAGILAESAESSGRIRQDLWQNMPRVVVDAANINTSLNTKTNSIQILNKKKEGECTSENDSLHLPAEKITTPNPIAPPPSPTAPQPSFEEFWLAFDKKEDKHKCQQQWDTLTPAEQSLAIERVPTYVLATPEKRYRKNPFTWLHHKCWLDEELPPPAGLLHGQAAVSKPPPARASSSPSKKKTCWS